MSNTGAAAGVTVGRAAGGTGGDADPWSCNEPLDGFKVVAVGVANPWKILNLGGGVLLHAVAQCMPAADNATMLSCSQRQSSGNLALQSARTVLRLQNCLQHQFLLIDGGWTPGLQWPLWTGTSALRALAKSEYSNT